MRIKRLDPNVLYPKAKSKKIDMKELLRLSKRARIETKVVKDPHTFLCDTCYDMERRGYASEEEYFDDKKLKPIKYKLILQLDKKHFDALVQSLGEDK